MSEINNRFKVKKGLDVTGDVSVTGSITLPTLAQTDTSTKVATTEFVKTAIANLVSSAPGSLDTLKELADALGSDPNFATTISNNLALKAPLASPTLTGTPSAPTASPGTTSDQLATTSFVASAVGTAVSPKANIVSPNFVGVPTAPTPSAGTNTTQLATAAFVSVAVANAKVNTALTGTPTAPTAAAGTANTQIATTAYVDQAVYNIKESPGTLTGDVAIASGLGADDNKIILIPGGARLTTIQDSITGAIKIKLPVLNSTTMMTFDVTVYEYITGSAFTLTISGYNYTGNSWTNTSVVQSGGQVSKTPTIRFGNDGSTNAIWIGELNSVWAYPQVYITNVRLGFQGLSRDWYKNWTVSFVTTFDNIALARAPEKLATLESPTFSGVPVAPTAGLESNDGQIVNTNWVRLQGFLKSSSVNLTGTPTAPTATAGTNNTQIATTGFVKNSIDALIAAAPGALDTLNELAAALGNDPNFATTINNSLATKATLASPILSGVPQAPTAAVDTATTQIASTAFVTGQGYLKASTAATTYASLNSPGFGGTPTTPTAPLGTVNNQIASAEFVNNAKSAVLFKAIAGNISLTAQEASYRVLVFTGTLSGAATVTIPTSYNLLTIDNRTAGGFPITVKLASGVGVAVPSGYKNEVYSDSVNVYSTRTDFADVFLGGAATAVTAGGDDVSNRIATTQAVRSAINAVFPLYNKDTVLSLTTGVWFDTGVEGGFLGTGAYVVSMFVDDNAVAVYSERYSGVMTWFAGGTNSGETNEIPLHSAGHAPNNRGYFLRTQRNPSGILKLQVSAEHNCSPSINYNFQFRRLIG